MEQPNRLQPRPVRSVLVPPNRLLAHLVLPSKNRPVRSVLVHLNPPLQPRSVLANNKQPQQAAFLVLPNKNRPVLGSAPLHLQQRLLVLHLLALGKLISLSIFLLVCSWCSNRHHHGQTTSHQKVYFNEFVQNSLCCNISIVSFSLHGYGGC